MRKDVRRIDRPFARDLERTDSPALLPSGFRFSPEQPGFGTFPYADPRVRRETCLGEGVRRLACFRWRSRQYAPHPSTSATTVFVTGFRQRFVPSSQTSLRTCGGHRRRAVCWRPHARPARCRTLFNFSLQRLRKVELDLFATRRFFVSGALVPLGLRVTDLRILVIIQHMLW